MTADHERDMRIYNASFPKKMSGTYEIFELKGKTSFLVVTVDWNQTGKL